MKKQIEKALDEIRPFLQSDGGNIKLISFTETEVKVKLLGNCVNSDVALIYNEITKKMIKFLVERNKNLPPTEILKIKTMAGCQ